MKPPNFRKLDFDKQDLDLVKKIEHCGKCKYCKGDNYNYRCRKYNYKLNIRVLTRVYEFTICDFYSKDYHFYKKGKSLIKKAGVLLSKLPY